MPAGGCCYETMLLPRTSKQGKEKTLKIVAFGPSALRQQFSMSSLSPVLRYVIIIHCKLTPLSRRQNQCCLAGDIAQCRLPGAKVCNFTMNVSSGAPQPIISNVALGPSALGQHWKLLASAHHLIKPHCKLATLFRRQKPMLPGRRYRSMSPAGRQSLQFYNECIKW